MPYVEISPDRPSGLDPDDEELSEYAWKLPWSDGAEALAAQALPALVDHRTSGSGGVPTYWRRTREQLWREAGLLADLLRPYRPEAVLSFAPPRHLFGTLATLLVPARLGIPVWYRPGLADESPPADGRRWAVMAIPWTFSLLRARSPWVRQAADLTFLHSTATLPASAADLVAEAGQDRARIIEVLGSTESGGVASRLWNSDLPRWQLLPDTEFAWQAPAEHGEERPLEIRGPRVASRPGETPSRRWQMDDYVAPTGDREFVFSGRRERLVKVNGERISLDTVEERLRSALNCSDLAALPVTHDTIGEHYDLYVVPATDQHLTRARVTAAAAGLGPRPHKVHLVERIERSETGKARRLQPAISQTTGVDT